MQRINLQPSYVLHTRPFRESSLLVEAFTEEHGRIALVANGVRKAKDSIRGLLQPFIPLLLSWTGRRDLMTLRAVESTGNILRFSYPNLVNSLYLNELLMRLLMHSDPYPDLFHHYQTTLQQLGQETDHQVTLRLFEKKLLKAIGYELQLTVDIATGQQIQEEGWYLFDHAKGPMFVDDVSLHDNNAIYKGSSLLALASEQLHDTFSQKEAKRLMRQALFLHLGNKPLESRRLFQ